MVKPNSKKELNKTDILMNFSREIGLEKMNVKTIFALGISFVVLIFALVGTSSMLEDLDAGETMVIQHPVSGKLSWFQTPGVKWQGWGKVTTYPKRTQLWFAEGKRNSHTIKIRFNDGGHATISGSISWEMPTSEDKLNSIHTKYTSPEAVEEQLIRTIMEKVIYMTGPMMSSTESYAARRTEMLNLIEDQLVNGVYMTKTVKRIKKDELLGTDKQVDVVELILDKDQKPVRAEESPLAEFDIRTFNLAIDEIIYEETVENQIKQQQSATMKVQLAIAEAKTAEQQVATTKAEGEASAEKAKWAQKTIAATKTTEAEMTKEIAETKAEQELAVAKLATEAAEQFKLTETAKGEGEAARRKLVMEADGALEKKLEAWMEAQKAYAQALGVHNGPWVPSVIMNSGSSDANGTTAATDLISLLMVKTAKDLGLDMNMGTAVAK